MRILIQSLLFIVVVFVFAVTSDKLKKVEESQSMANPQTESAAMSDQEFITLMIEHHEGAIAMAKQAKQKSNRQDLKTYSDRIILDQSQEVDQLYSWRKDWFGEMEHVEMRMGADMPSMAVDLGVNDAEFDLRFLDAMIAHHEGAVKMAKTIVIPTDRPEIHNLATNIYNSQTQEIQQMQQWRKEWYGK